MDRGGMVWEIFAQKLYTWINFSNLWELANLPCATIGVGDCEVNHSSLHEASNFMNVHLEAPCAISNAGLLCDMQMVYALDHMYTTVYNWYI